MRQDRSTGALWIAATALLMPIARAQSPIPDPHWGATAIPTMSEEMRFDISLNRFTEFNRDDERFPSEIDETTGFLIPTFSINERLPRAPRVTYGLAAGVGFSADQPSRALQNDVIHNLLGIDHVPVERTRSELEAAVGGHITVWSRDMSLFGSRATRDWAQQDRFRYFVGIGTRLSTQYDEMHAHMGTTWRTPRYSFWIFDGHVEFSAMARFNFTRPGDAYPDVAGDSLMGQFSLAYLPARVEKRNWLGSPSLMLTITEDSGLFEDARSGAPLDTRFISARIDWPSGMLFETWNDMLNQSDYGPTYGFVVGFDLLTLFGDTGGIR